jgi:hypothetical protein
VSTVYLGSWPEKRAFAGGFPVRAGVEKPDQSGAGGIAPALWFSSIAQKGVDFRPV